MPNGSFLVWIVVWLIAAEGSSASVWISSVVQNRPDQILASGVYSNLSSSSNAISIRAWFNIPSQNVTSMRQLISVQPSASSAVMLPAINMVNSSHAAIELSTTASGNGTELHLFPYSLMFNEWFLVDIVIPLRGTRNMTITMLFPDGTIRSLDRQLNGAMLNSKSSYLMMTSRYLGLPPANSFLSYLAISNHASGISDLITTTYETPPDQLYYNDTTAGGQIFETGGVSVNLTCQRPGFRLTAIRFASFGRPYGVYPNFIVNPICHATTTLQTIAAHCIGAVSCRIQADRAIFGDPCPGYRKNLAVLAVCGPAEAIQMENADLSPPIVSQLPVSKYNLHPVQFASELNAALHGVNVSLQVLFSGPTDDYTVLMALASFAQSFCSQFNTTIDRILYPSLRQLRWPLMLLSFTLLPPTTLFDTVSARQLAETFSHEMQRADAHLRQTVLLSGASQPPVPISIVDVNLRLCTGNYIFVQTNQDSCSVIEASDQELSTLSPAIVAVIIAASILFLVAAILTIRFKFGKRLSRGTSGLKLKEVESPLNIAVSLPPGATEVTSPNSFTVVKSGADGRPVSQPSKLSIRHLPMRIDRLATVARQSYHVTDSETDSAFLSDFNNLSIESGPARVDQYFTDSS